MGLEQALEGLSQLEAEMNEAGINAKEQNFALTVVEFHSRLTTLESQVSNMTDEVSAKITKIRSYGSALTGAAYFLPLPPIDQI